MRLRTVLVLVLIALVAVFAAVNWTVILAPAHLNLLFASFDAPLGLLMLGILAAVVLGFIGYMAAWQGRVLMEFRSSAKELERQRVLADVAEASRFTDLRAAFQSEMQRSTDRMGQLEQALATDIREHANSLAAALAEMDERLRRGAPAERLP